MRILHVITSLQIGGAEKLMVDLLPRLQAKGHAVELCIFYGIKTTLYKEIEQKGIKIHSLGMDSNVYNLYYLFRLFHLMQNYDIVHTHNTAPQLFAAIANIIRKKIIVTTEHNTTNRRRNKWYLKQGDLWMYKQYKKIICISDRSRDNLANYIGNSSKIVTIYNGIEISRFTNAMSFAKRDTTIKIITMVSSFRPQKDHKTLIKAFSLLPNYCYLQLVGDGESRMEIENFSKQFACSDRILFMGNRNDIPNILKNSDVIVLSSHYEGLSLSSIEGMASGQPFIASDVDGLHEVVNGYGILFPHEDFKALANAILHIFNDKEFAREVADQCQKRARRFGISCMAEKYHQLYMHII